MTPRWFAYWTILRPLADMALCAALAVAEVLHLFGVERIGRHRIIDTLLDLEADL